jgi:outer membrane protein assembly factor BamB
MLNSCELRSALLAAMLISFCPRGSAADWPQFRGVAASSVAADSQLPTTWNEKDHENVAWKVELTGRGASSPIVVAGRVIVTAATGFRQERLHVLCFAADSGKKLWHRSFWATGRTATHDSISSAAPSPASDGRSIFAFYSSNDLFCLDLDGKLHWYRGLAYDFPKAGNDIGMSASPVVIDGVVVVQIENQGDSFAAGIDSANGETLWRVERPNRANWCSPIALPGSGNRQTAVLLQSTDRLTAVAARTGEELWKIDAEVPGIPSSLLSGDLLLTPANGFTALRLSATSNAPEIAWDSNRLRPASASPVAYDGRVYTMSNDIVRCGDLATGDVIWQLRLKGRHWATPVIAGGLLYCINEEGQVSVVKTGGSEGEIVGQASFGETIQGSPAIAGHAMFVRSDKHLWKIASRQ